MTMVECGGAAFWYILRTLFRKIFLCAKKEGPSFVTGGSLSQRCSDSHQLPATKIVSRDLFPQGSSLSEHHATYFFQSYGCVDS